MVLSTAPYNKFAVQTAPDGRILGGAIFLPADVISRFVTDGAGEVVYKLKPIPEGILIEIGGDRS